MQCSNACPLCANSGHSAASPTSRTTAGTAFFHQRGQRGFGSAVLIEISRREPSFDDFADLWPFVVKDGVPSRITIFAFEEKIPRKSKPARCRARGGIQCIGPPLHAPICEIVHRIAKHQIHRFSRASRTSQRQTDRSIRFQLSLVLVEYRESLSGRMLSHLIPCDPHSRSDRGARSADARRYCIPLRISKDPTAGSPIFESRPRFGWARLNVVIVTIIVALPWKSFSAPTKTRSWLALACCWVCPVVMAPCDPSNAPRLRTLRGHRKEGR
jgi:hypothetical protein